MDRRLRPRYIAAAALLGWCAGLLSGCAQLAPPLVFNGPLPPGHTEIRVGRRYVFHTDLRLKPDHPVLREIAELPERVARELQCPAADCLVQVYLFEDRGSYERYLRAHFGHLPPRRALFVARPGLKGEEELLVFAFWGEQILKDLRHELTHAELHSACPNIPLWLDEGLAEFFEVPPEHDGVHYRHLAALRSESASPWSPSLERLEKLTQLRDMTPGDYREAWAWTHFLLRSTDELRGLLLQYLRELREHTRSHAVADASGTSTLPSLTERLRQTLPDPEKALLEHLAFLQRQSRHLTAALPEMSLETGVSRVTIK
ncbi:MAG: hypothetical protein RMJ19_08645 [Gemmatales bacterium]|nr:DUF1570 domain-containing protein [Gemmatales bacterium]MDW8175727.1 hypothetical protein [Gemmatales bacterium]